MMSWRDSQDTTCCKLLKIKKISTTTYHPQANGSLERNHRPLTDYLRIFTQKHNQTWYEFLALAMFVKIPLYMLVLNIPPQNFCLGLTQKYRHL